MFERQRQAEAAKIEAEKKAEADLALANADAAAKKALAEAIKAQGEAEAAAAKAKGLAEAEAIRAKAEAEAKGMLEKAAALKEYGDAAKQQMELDAIKVLYEQLPAIAEAIGISFFLSGLTLVLLSSRSLALLICSFTFLSRNRNLSLVISYVVISSLSSSGRTTGTSARLTVPFHFSTTPLPASSCLNNP